LRSALPEDRFAESFPAEPESWRSPDPPSTEPVTVLTSLLTGRLRSADGSGRSPESDCRPVTACCAVSTTWPAVRRTAPLVRTTSAVPLPDTTRSATALFVTPLVPRPSIASSVAERPAAPGRDGSGGAVELTVWRSSRVFSRRGTTAWACSGAFTRGFGSGRRSISARTCCAIGVVRSLSSGSGAVTASSTPLRRVASSCTL
jgi:hypothetical protein